MMGVSQGAYIQGYGVVFLGEVNLAPAAGISPFHTTVSADEVRRTHDKKMSAWPDPQLRCRHAGGFGALAGLGPAEEQVAVGLSLFYWKWENRDGLPSQIVMHAPRKVLLQSAGAEQASIASRRVLVLIHAAWRNSD